MGGSTTTIRLSKYSDLRKSFVFRDQEGNPINLTGAVVDIAEQHPELGATITVTNAAQGEGTIVAERSDNWPMGKSMYFRVRISFGSSNLGWPLILVEIT